MRLIRATTLGLAVAVVVSVMAGGFWLPVACGVGASITVL